MTGYKLYKLGSVHSQKAGYRNARQSWSQDTSKGQITTGQQGTGTQGRGEVRVQAGISSQPESEVQECKAEVESEYKPRSQQVGRNPKIGQRQASSCTGRQM